VLFVAYVSVLGKDTDSAKLSPASGRALYSRVGPFADCRKFDPPARARRLCEPPSAEREQRGTNYYLHDPSNPAKRAFGDAGQEDGLVRAFAVAAILGQPLDYLSAVADDLGRFARPEAPGGEPGDIGFYVELARNPDFENLAIERGSGYYDDVERIDRSSPDALMDYATTVLVDGWLMLLFLLTPVVSLLITRGGERQCVAIFAGTAWLLVLVSAATTDYDPRYGAVALPALAAATAPALGVAADSFGRLRARRRLRDPSRT
jgi:hypothetical protein